MCFTLFFLFFLNSRFFETENGLVPFAMWMEKCRHLSVECLDKPLALRIQGIASIQQETYLIKLEK